MTVPDHRDVTGAPARPGGRLRLPYQPPYPLDDTLAFLAARAIPGVEVVADGAFHRIEPRGDGTRHLTVRAADRGDALELTRDAVGPHEVAPLVRRVRRTFDLDADPVTVDAALAGDLIIGASVRAMPGRRLPGAIDPWATLVLAIAAQGVTLAAARVTLGRLVARHGSPAGDGATFPSPSRLADPTCDLEALGFPPERIGTVRTVAAAVAAGTIDLEYGDPVDVRTALAEIRGIGPWTLGYVALRIAHDPDAFPPGDAAVRSAFRRHGLATDDRAIARAAEAWRPWRGYAVMHLWSPAIPS